MSNLQSLLTDEGSLESQSAVINGWYVKIVDFGVSETLGNYEVSRDISSINPMFAYLPISGSVPVDNQTRQINLSIPPNVLDPLGNIISSNKNINELYLFAEGNGFIYTVDLANNELIVDNQFYLETSTGKEIRFNLGDGAVMPSTTPNNITQNKTFYIIKKGLNRVQIALTKANALADIPLTFVSSGSGVLKISKYYLYALGQFTPTPLLYQFTGETKLRGQLTITNMSTFVLNFTYTQSFEIEDHNINPNAHPDIQSSLNYNGIFVNDVDFTYKGQRYIKNAVFHNSVVNNDVVYLNANGKFYPALSIIGDESKWKGIAKLSENKVIIDGCIDMQTSIPRGQDVYLSTTLGGKITSTLTNHKIGYSLGGGIVNVSSQGSSNINFIDDLNNVVISNKQINDVLIIDPTGATNNFVNKQFLLSYAGDVNISNILDKQILIHNGTEFINRKLQLNDIQNVLISNTPSGKYLRHNGTNFIDSDLQIPVTDGLNSYNNIKAFSFGAGFTVTESLGTATINFGGSGGGLTALVDDLSPQLGGDLDVFGGNQQIRPLVNYTTLTNQPSSNTFTDNGAGINFGANPQIGVNQSYLRITINGNTYTVLIAFVSNANTLTLNDVIPDILTTDTVSYEIIRPLVYKITNTNILGDNTVKIDRLNSFLGANLETKGFNIVSGGAFDLGIISNQLLNIQSGIQGTSINSSGDILLSTPSVNKKVDVNDYVFPRPINPLSYKVNFPTNITMPSVGQGLVISQINGTDINLQFQTLSFGGSFSIVNARTTNNQAPLVVSSTSTTGTIRGLLKGTNINFNYRDVNGSVISGLSGSTDIEIVANMNLGNGSFSGAFETVFKKVGNDTQIFSKGIRGAGSITVTEETATDGSGRKNIVISGSSSGGGGGIALGSTNNAGGGAGLIVSNATNAFWAINSSNGFYGNGNVYGSFIENSSIAGTRYNNNPVGIMLNANNKSQLLLEPKFTFSNPQHALPISPVKGELAFIESNQIVSNTQTVGSGLRNNPLGIYIYDGSNWREIALGNAYRVNP